MIEIWDDANMGKQVGNSLKEIGKEAKHHFKVRCYCIVRPDKVNLQFTIISAFSKKYERKMYFFIISLDTVHVATEPIN